MVFSELTPLGAESHIGEKNDILIRKLSSRPNAGVGPEFLILSHRSYGERCIYESAPRTDPLTSGF